MFCLLVAGSLALRPDPWGRADMVAQQDAEKFAQLLETPDRVSWRLTEDAVLLRVLLWDDEGQRRYPPPGGMAPLPYEFSEDMIRVLTSIQANIAVSAGTGWTTTSMAMGELLYCQAEPAICLIYDRALLEDELGLRAEALAQPNQPRPGAMVMLGLAGLCAAGAVWARRRGASVEADIAAEAETAPAPKPIAFQILPERHLAIRDSLEVSLSPRDLKLLTILQDRDGAVVTKDELYDVGWGREYMPNSRALDQHMITLRRKLDPNKSRPVLIETVRGVGYRMVQ
ncbi:MAG: winged helix-turn-helix domain-containing protein [Mangrovicoccus sp.]